MSKHIFSLYVDGLSRLKGTADTVLLLRDSDLMHRIQNVLRIQRGEELILFDRHMHIRVCFKSCSSHGALSFDHVTWFDNVPLKPEIFVLMPFLKKEALEEAVYSAAEIGATVIQLTVTEKSRRSFSSANEIERLQRVVISAAEQSKNFSVPSIEPPVSIEKMLACVSSTSNLSSVCKIVLDGSGNAAYDVMAQAHELRPEHIFLAFGPEGDFTEQEKLLLRDASFISCRLTGSVMRSSQACAVALGMLRSFL